MIATGSNKPRHTMNNSSGSALAAALALSDERSSLVVLQGDGRGSLKQWLSYVPASFIGQFLVGQQAVCILLQQPDETVAHLHDRIRERLATLEEPPQRLLWVTPEDATGPHLLRLYAALTQHCRDSLEVLLVTGNHLMAVEPFSILTGEGASPAAGSLAAGSPAAAVPTAAAPETAVLPTATCARSAPPAASAAAPPQAERPPSAPPRSEVRWSRPSAPEIGAAPAKRWSAR